jgi:hypothetical protein
VRDYVFARREEEWFLQYGEKTSKLELELAGPPFIQYLLKYPDRKIHVKELWFEVMKPSGSKTKMNDEVAELNSFLSDGEEILDRTAKETFRRRLMELSQERIEAMGNNDGGQLERINTEFETIQSVLKSAHGLGGRDKKIGNEVIKLRDRIRHLMSTVFKRLGKSDPNLAEYLRNSIECGVHAQYKSSSEVTWAFE